MTDYFKGKILAIFLLIIIFLNTAPVLTAYAVEENDTKPIHRIIFRDDFSNPETGWEVSDIPQYLSLYVNGKYEIQSKKPITIFNYAKQLIIPETYYSVNAEMEFIESKQGIYGLFINYINREEVWYRFLVNPFTQCYALSRQTKAGLDYAVNWTESKQINKNTEKNILRIELYDCYVKLFINGQFLQQVAVTDIKKQTKTGVMLIAKQEGIRAQYDNFEINALSPEKGVNVSDLFGASKEKYVLVEGKPEGKKEETALEAIDASIRLMEQLWEVQLSRQVQVFMFRSKNDFKKGLIKYCNMSDQIAGEYAVNSVAVASQYYILVSKERVGDNKNLQNIMAHEVIHIFQHDRSVNGRSSPMLRCFVEGYSYYNALIFSEEWESYKKDAYANIKYLVEVVQYFPKLTEINNIKSYWTAFDTMGENFFESYMVVAMDFLIKKANGHNAFKTYFSGGLPAEPVDESFKSSFGMTPEEFEIEFQKYLKELASKT